MEPADVNTVSYFNVSAEILTLASVEVINVSFRQEKRISKKDMPDMSRVFIDVKSTRRI